MKPDGLPEPQVSLVPLSTNRERFGLPRKLICMNASGSYTAETHQVTLFILFLLRSTFFQTFFYLKLKTSIFFIEILLFHVD